MTIDILMATYNGEKYLEEQLRSILNQSVQDFRLLICDDQSTDGTNDIIDRFLKKHPGKIFKVVSDKKLGAKGNFSFLMEHSEASYLMFADQDDIWKHDKIAKTYAEMKRLETVHGKDLPLLVHTDLTVVNKDCAVLGDSFWKYTNLNAKSFHTINRFLIQNVVTGCTIMMNRPLCNQSLPVPEESLMHDWWIALVAAAFGKIGLVSEPTILYRQHGSNTLGAKKFGGFRLLKEAFKKLIARDTSFQKQIIYRQNQAKTFLNRYQGKLTLPQIRTTEDYIKLNDSSWLKKRLMMIKHGFYRSGFIRNSFTFLIRFHP